jgi:PTH1 family peptidyl-tRNA hydrolase
MELNKKLKALVAKIKISKEKAQIIFPETFMNNSGNALKPIIKSKKMAERLIVVHDDIDLPLGKFRISFASGSAGHRGVESVIKAMKTKNFIRIRVGISPLTPSGKIKKPEAKKVIDYLMAKFKAKEFQIIKKVALKITPAIKMIMDEGLQKAMSVYN